jgi:hypothetical protein
MRERHVEGELHLKVWDEDFVGSVENKSRVRSRGTKWKPILALV